MRPVPHIGWPSRSRSRGAPRAPHAGRARRARSNLLLFLLLAGVMSVTGGPARAGDDVCLACHAEPTLTTERGGRTVNLHVRQDRLAASAHRGATCTDCHRDFDAESLPHAARIVPVDCMACHTDPASSHTFHASMTPPGGADLAGAPATCKSCHGAHDVPRATPSAQGRLAPGRTCTPCHEEIVREYLGSRHGRVAAEGVTSAPTCLSCHEKPYTEARLPGDLARRKLTQDEQCLDCHLNDAEVRARMGPQAGFIAAYQGSVHGAALLRGEGNAAGCVDCHGSHVVAHGSDPQARVNRSHLVSTCARCHASIAQEYESSVHGEALARGVSRTPVCTDCHGEHTVYRTDDPRSPVAARNVSVQVCTPCHSSMAIAAKYGLPVGRAASFADSYHGLALRGGSLEAANCASCHGAHNIRPSADPASTVHPSNLARTCGRCHPGANDRFAIGAVHVVIEKDGEPLLFWIAFGYITLIVATIGGMLVHNLLDFVRKARHRFAVRRGDVVEELADRGLYERMSLFERLQHGSLMISFSLLVVTGFMLRYPEAFWVEWLRSLSERAFDLRSLIHRTAGVVMVLASVAHLGYIFVSARGRRLVRDLLPQWRDALDALAMVRYNAGLSSSKPLFGRFGYIEKAEYWALLWGTGVMAATGAVLWFENVAIGLLTKLGWDVARTIHFYEAWLATLAILVWHIYYVVFNPDVYPMNTAWWTGQVTEQDMEEDHPLELAEIRRGREAAEHRLREAAHALAGRAGGRDGDAGDAGGAAPGEVTGSAPEPPTTPDAPV